MTIVLFYVSFYLNLHSDFDFSTIHIDKKLYRHSKHWDIAFHNKSFRWVQKIVISDSLYEKSPCAVQLIMRESRFLVTGMRVQLSFMVWLGDRLDSAF